MHFFQQLTRFDPIDLITGFILVLTPFSSLLAEDQITFPIAYFAVKCNEILEAEPIQHNTVNAIFWKTNSDDWDWVQVRILKVYRSNFYKAGDTLWVTCGSSYEWPKASNNEDFENHLSYKDAIVRLWLFGQIQRQSDYRTYGSDDWDKGPFPPGRSAYLQVESSGIRPENQNGIVFTPFQRENPGQYIFFAKENEESGITNSAKMRECVAHNVQIADELFSIRKIANRLEQNDSLFSWINRNKVSLTLNHYFPDSWMWTRELPFAWIFNNGKDEQAWEAVLLYNQFFPEDRLYGSSGGAEANGIQARYENYYPKIAPFHSSKGIAFLQDKIKDVSLSASLRNHSMTLLRDALQGNINLNDRKNILRNLLISAQKDTFLNKQELVEMIQFVGFWKENDFQQNLPEAYQFMVKAYQNESFGYIKNNYASFLVKESTAEEWKLLNGSDAKILVDLYNFKMDTTKKTLNFSCRQEYGYEQIFECPNFDMFQIDKKGEHINQQQIPQSALCSGIDWTKKPLDGEICLQFQLDDNLSRGIWYFRSSGAAGQKNEFRWRSELGVCRY